MVWNGELEPLCQLSLIFTETSSSSSLSSQKSYYESVACVSASFGGNELLFVVKYVASMLLIFLGSMDCLTTVVGTLYFRTQELNPLIADLVNTNLPAFVVVKLVATVSVGVIFVLAEKNLLRSGSFEDRTFRLAHKTLKVAYVGISLFLVLVVVNNILVLLRAL